MIDKNSNTTLEAQIVRVCDCIAYINHDIDDALRYNILKESDIPNDIINVVGKRHSERINTMASSVIEYSMHKDYIDIGTEVLEATEALKDFMFKNVYFSEAILNDVVKVNKIIETLFDYFLDNITEIESTPNFYFAANYKDDIEKVKDFIAYLTDIEAIKYYDIISYRK